MGIILGQIGPDGKERIIECGSKLFNRREIHYLITEKELRAVIYALAYFYDYLIHAKFKIVTDHKALIS